MPWTWTIQCNDSAKCPSLKSTLGTFATINAVVGVLDFVAGHIIVVRYCSCGLCGRSVKSWKYMWLWNLFTQLAANATVAVLMRRVDGYQTDYAIWQLMLFYAFRPRLSWFILALFETYSVKIYDDKGYWYASAMSSLVAEFVLQVMAMYTMGTTVHFAAIRSYYVVGSKAQAHLPQGARVMYVGAMWYLVAGFAAYGWYLPIAVRDYLVEGRDEEQKLPGQDVSRGLFSMGILVWFATWLFWGGYLVVAKEQ